MGVSWVVALIIFHSKTRTAFWDRLPCCLSPCKSSSLFVFQSFRATSACCMVPPHRAWVSVNKKKKSLFSSSSFKDLLLSGVRDRNRWRNNGDPARGASDWKEFWWLCRVPSVWSRPMEPPHPREIPDRTPGYTRVLVNDEVSDEHWQLSLDVTAYGMSQERPVVLVTSGHWMRCRTCFCSFGTFWGVWDAQALAATAEILSTRARE